MVKIKDKDAIFLGCLEECLVTIIGDKHRNFYKLFFYNWDFGFEFDEQNSKYQVLTKQVNKKAVLNLLDICQKYYGILFEQVSYKEFVKKMNIYTHPMIVHADIYYCSWTEGYKKIHASHYFIVTIREDVFYIHDSYANDLQKEIVINSLDNIHIERIFIYSIKESADGFHERVFYDYIKKNCDLYYNMLEEIKKFRDNIEVVIEQEIENTDNELKYNIFLKTLTELEHSRKNITFLLSEFEYLPDKVVNNFMGSYKRWGILKKLIVMYAIRKREEYINYVKDALDDIYFLEKENLMLICER